jgi:hypothetical protein
VSHHWNSVPEIRAHYLLASILKIGVPTLSRKNIKKPKGGISMEKSDLIRRRRKKEFNEKVYLQYMPYIELVCEK